MSTKPQPKHLPRCPQKRVKPTALPASRFLRAHRRRIITAVVAWSGGKKYTVNQLVRDLSQRCDELDLRAEAEDPVQVTAYLTALVTNYLFTGKFKRTK